MELAESRVSKGVVHLKKAKEYQDSKCAPYCIRMQLTCIIILSICLIVKYM